MGKRNQTVLEGQVHRLGTRGGTELGVDVADVTVDGADTEVELLGDLFISPPIAEEPQHLQLPLAQALGRRRCHRNHGALVMDQLANDSFERSLLQGEPTLADHLDRTD